MAPCCSLTQVILGRVLCILLVVSWVYLVCIHGCRDGVSGASRPLTSMFCKGLVALCHPVDSSLDTTAASPRINPDTT